MLGSTERPLSSAHDVAVLDLDGVVYVGGTAVEGAPDALNQAQAAGMHLAFVTNNAARPPGVVGQHLRKLGVDAHDEDVVTSAQAAARLLSDKFEPGSRVFLVGGLGLEEALRERDLEPVTERSDDVVAVVQGYGPDMPWEQIMQGAVLVRSGLPWVATNTDMTIPTPNGIAPGNGALVRLIAEFAQREPQVAGKPEPPLFEETLRRVGGERPLVIGDRLDTDIQGAVTMGWDSLLVLTGVTGLEELVRAEAKERPTYVAPDLSALAEPQPAPDCANGRATLGGWTATVDGDRLTVSGDGSAADWWRVVAVAAWAHLDENGQPVVTDGLQPPG
jgi:glycerol 3-phosphatase-2